MSPARYYYLENSRDETIKNLERELHEARHAIISLMPEKIQLILYDYESYQSREETYSWRHRIADRILELAKVLPPDQGSYWSDRAYCPLCGGGRSLQEGFGFPEGLRRHLVGQGNVHKCVVVEAAARLAGEHWNSKFHAAEMAEEAEKQALKLQRKGNETLYRIAPDLDPVLIDEDISSTSIRNDSEMAWAEQRLTDLGFQVSWEGNVKSYTSEHENFVVYADLRMNGTITFQVHKKPLPKRRSSSRPRNARYFYLKDSWKNDIPGKYQSRLAEATKS